MRGEKFWRKKNEKKRMESGDGGDTNGVWGRWDTRIKLALEPFLCLCPVCGLIRTPVHRGSDRTDLF
jgi:hypothetical protein